MNYTCDHEQNRIKLCAPCGRKIVVTKGKILSFYRITDSHKNLIKKFLNPNYESSDSQFPLGICNTCRKTLSEYNENKKHLSLIHI